METKDKGSLSRRSFIKVAGVAAGGILLGGCGGEQTKPPSKPPVSATPVREIIPSKTPRKINTPVEPTDTPSPTKTPEVYGEPLKAEYSEAERYLTPDKIPAGTKESLITTTNGACLYKGRGENRKAESIDQKIVDRAKVVLLEGPDGKKAWKIEVPVDLIDMIPGFQTLDIFANAQVDGQPKFIASGAINPEKVGTTVNTQIDAGGSKDILTLYVNAGLIDNNVMGVQTGQYRPRYHNVVDIGRFDEGKMFEKFKGVDPQDIQIRIYLFTPTLERNPLTGKVAYKNLENQVVSVALGCEFSAQK